MARDKKYRTAGLGHSLMRKMRKNQPRLSKLWSCQRLGKLVIGDETCKLKPGKRAYGTILQPTAADEPIVRTITARQAQGNNAYYVNSRQGAEQELRDEEQIREGSDGGDLLDITEEDIERLEGKGATAINPNEIEKLQGDERKNDWSTSGRAGLIAQERG